jgi:hypothetical protein
VTLPNRDELTLAAWLRDTASPIPPEVADTTLTVIHATPQSRSGWRSWPRIETFRLAGLAGAVALVAITTFAVLRTTVPASAPGGIATAPTGFEGTWETIDCAQWWRGGRPVDCSVWGDSSRLRLTVGLGTEPTVTYEDSSAVCPARPAELPRFTVSGTGTFTPPHLWLTFASTGCPSFGKNGDGAVQLYRDPGSDTLWEDEDGDGWGLIWRRAP